MHRPTLDDARDAADSLAVERLTRDTLEVFKRAQVGLQRLRALCDDRGTTDVRQAVVRRNAAAAMAVELQQLSSTFRQSQRSYLASMQQRQHAVLAPLAEDHDDDEKSRPSDQRDPAGRLAASQLQVDVDRHLIDERVREIEDIVQSIDEVNQLYRDLSLWITDQGVMLDTIEHNVIETQAATSVAAGQLQQATAQQRGNMKKRLMLLLALAIVAVLIAFAIKHR